MIVKVKCNPDMLAAVLRDQPNLGLPLVMMAVCPLGHTHRGIILALHPELCCASVLIEEGSEHGDREAGDTRE